MENVISRILLRSNYKDQRRSPHRRGQSTCYRTPSLRLPTKVSIQPRSSGGPPLLQRSRPRRIRGLFHLFFLVFFATSVAFLGISGHFEAAPGCC